MIALLAALALTFAACGDDDDAASTSPSPSVSATATEDAPGDSDTPKPSSTPKKTATTRPTDVPTETPVDATPEIDECALVTLDELADATGDVFTQEGAPDSFDPDTCYFDGDAGTLVEITTYDLSGTGADATEEFEFVADLLELDLLDSPGDEAYYDEDLGLAVLVEGQYELDVYVSDADDNILREPAFAIGEAAVARWP
jgi:hypothetical protein